MKPHLPKVQKTFVNENLEKQLEQKGYVVLPSMMLEEEIMEMNTFYSQASASRIKGEQDLKKTIEDKDLRPKMSKMLKNILQRLVTEFFVDHRVIAGHFIVKEPFVDADIKIHHEFSFLDEKVFRPINLWSPLIDVDVNTGAMQVLPESHNLSNLYRGYSLPSPYSRIFSDFPVFCKNVKMKQTPRESKIGKKLLERFVTIPMKKGDLMVFDSRLLHRTYSVTENTTRVAAAGLVAPSRAELYNYQGKTNTLVEEYEINDDFYLTWNNFDSPEKEKLIRQFEHDFFTLCSEDERLLYRLANGRSDKLSWLPKAIRSLFVTTHQTL